VKGGGEYPTRKDFTVMTSNKQLNFLQHVKTLLKINGKAAIAQNLVNGTAFGSTEFHVIRPGPKLTAEWLHALIRHKAFRDDAETHFKGTAGQQRVPRSFLEQKSIPVPPLIEQRRLVAELDALKAPVNVLKHLQAETTSELDALLPSILQRAFRGEL